MPAFHAKDLSLWQKKQLKLINRGKAGKLFEMSVTQPTNLFDPQSVKPDLIPR